MLNAAPHEPAEQLPDTDVFEDWLRTAPLLRTPPEEPQDFPGIDALRLRGIFIVAVSTWMVAALIGLMALFTLPHVAVVFFLICPFAAATAYVAGTARIGRSGRLVAAATASFLPTLINVAFYAADMEPDLLLPYLGSIVALVSLCDRRIILEAGAMALAQYLILRAGEAVGGGISAKLAIGVSAEMIGLIIVIAISYSVVSRVSNLFATLHAKSTESAERADLLKTQSDELARALERAQSERLERERSEIEQAAQREAQIKRIAQDFEASFSVVTSAIAASTTRLERTTKALNTVAVDAGSNAADVAQAAQSASNATNNVAQGVSELSASIAGIAVNVSQQNALTTHATERSSHGGNAVESLARHTHTIGEATRAIVRIAERTNLLSLNAAIEAASAGPAGRGFTIVAQEVKALAMQASEAATEIDDFLKGVKSGTVEAERSFGAIDSAISELAQAATEIRWDVESQRKSADTIEVFARGAADGVRAMADRSKALASTASSAQKLSTQIDETIVALTRHVRELEQSAAHFVDNLKTG